MPDNPLVIEAPATVIPPTVVSPTIAGPDDHFAMPTKTALETEIKHSQMAVDKKWENVQGTIAVLITATICTMSLILVWKDQVAVAVGIMSGAFGLVVGQYFSRTNHVKVGGITENQTGR